MKVWVCANCGTPIEPFFPEAQMGEAGTGIRCPGTASGCSPHGSRELLCDHQVKQIETAREGLEAAEILAREAEAALDRPEPPARPLQEAVEGFRAATALPSERNR